MATETRETHTCVHAESLRCSLALEWGASLRCCETHELMSGKRAQRAMSADERHEMRNEVPERHRAPDGDDGQRRGDTTPREGGTPGATTRSSTTAPRVGGRDSSCFSKSFSSVGGKNGRTASRRGACGSSRPASPGSTSRRSGPSVRRGNGALHRRGCVHVAAPMCGNNRNLARTCALKALLWTGIRRSSTDFHKEADAQGP